MSKAAALTPGTSFWQWQLGGGPVDETVLDAVDNPKKMYDIDLFGTDAATIGRLHAKGITVICYMETPGTSENYRPDADQYPAAVLGNAVDGFPNERFVDIRNVDVLLPIVAARLDLAVSKGCDGIEPDLDDTYNGYDTGFPLTMQDQLTFNRAVADAAHARGLSIGLKNGASTDGRVRAGDGPNSRIGHSTRSATPSMNAPATRCSSTTDKAVFQVEYIQSGRHSGCRGFCPQDNAANFDGLLKDSSDSLAALPRVACRLD